MASITISELNVAGLNLFADPESYLDEVNDGELGSVKGGTTPIIVFATASSPECAVFAGGLIAGAGASVTITKAFR
ncbi:MAG: hypothetical protein NVSMB70_13610 [Chamaesiphon sp.]